MCQTQNLNCTACVNFAARTNCSTHTVFSGQRLPSCSYIEISTMIILNRNNHNQNHIPCGYKICLIYSFSFVELINSQFTNKQQ